MMFPVPILWIVLGCVKKSMFKGPTACVAWTGMISMILMFVTAPLGILIFPMFILQLIMFIVVISKWDGLTEQQCRDRRAGAGTYDGSGALYREGVTLMKPGLSIGSLHQVRVN
jgi:hypothetical protein